MSPLAKESSNSVEQDLGTFLWDGTNLLTTVRSFNVEEADEELAICAIAWVVFGNEIDEEEYYILKKYFNIQWASNIFEEIVRKLWLCPETWWELFQRLVRALKTYQIYEDIDDEESFSKNYRTLVSSDIFWDIVVSKDGERLYLIQEWDIYTYSEFFSANENEVQYFLFNTNDWAICYHIKENTLFKIEWDVWRAITWEWWCALISTTDTHEILSILNTWDALKKRKILQNDATTFFYVYSTKNGDILVNHAHIEREHVLKHWKKKGYDISDYDIRTYAYERLTKSDTWETLYETRWHISHFIETWEETFVIEVIKIYDSDFRNGIAEITQIVSIDEDEVVWDFLTETKHTIYQGSNTAIIIFYHDDSTDLYDIKSGVTYWEIQDLVVEEHPELKWEYFFSFIDGNQRNVKISTLFSSLEIEFGEEWLPLGVKDTKKWVH